ncbi:amidohydrolase family protein [Zestomonas carbonaria]|uniref:2-pyrone-4,6-dicarbaxylate hydrolase n=1 Tax=Zestomonas carbonaria TaxID=2762745 RepID=A0A7U7EL85_9GAMM|nr:amidohydrolase family protein [Pseudomonas carbonaria]CAD5106921.1 2-pyrone-4,6-dicarbaxylate hydrolase [Pseudomonas carbonaria]
MNPATIPVCQAADPAVRAPRFDVPALACDTHAHVFGPQHRYAYTANRTYTPPDAPLADYLALHRRLGIERGVLVQPSVYGTDNQAMLDALAQLGEHYRGVAVIDPDIDDRELQRLHQAGIRGVRVNLLFKGGISFADVERIAARIQPLGWHVQALLDVSEFDDLQRRLGSLPVDVVIDHMGHMDTAKGLGHPGFQALLQLLASGRCWVKLSAAYRFTRETATPYRDVLPVAQALVRTAPERMLWGSDWPHPFVHIPMPNDGALLDMLADWVPDAGLREQILVHNPARLYGFPRP